MNIRFYLILILSVIMTSFAFDPASAQNLLWEKKYMGLDTLPSTTYWARNRPAQLTELPDTTYLYLGWGQAQIGPGRFGYQDFKKLDKNGEIIWSRYIYPDTTTNVNPELDFWSFQVMENGNNLLIGKQAMDSPNIQLFYVLTLDAEGQKISDTTYYGDVIFTPWCSVKGPGGIAVGGYVHAGVSQYAYAVKIGYDMSKEWSFILNDEAIGGMYSQFNTIIANDDGSFDCYGQTMMTIQDPTRVLYVHLNAAGEMTRCIVYPDSLDVSQFADACGGPGYRILLAMSYGSEGLSLETIKVDLEGNLLWSNKYPDSSFVYHMPNAVDVTEENNLVITGQSYYYDSNHLPFSSGIFMLKTDSLGNKLWYQDYGTTLTTDSSEWAVFEYGKDIVAAMDGSYLIAASDIIDANYGVALSLLKIQDGYASTPGLPAPSENAVIYPNPFSNQATLILPEGKIFQNGMLKMFSLTGQCVRVISGINSGMVSISRDGLPPGIYIYSVEDQNKVLYRGKMIVN